MSSRLSQNIRHADRDTREVLFLREMVSTLDSSAQNYTSLVYLSSWVFEWRRLKVWTSWENLKEFPSKQHAHGYAFFWCFCACVSIYECSSLVLLYFFLPLPWRQGIKSCSLHQAKKLSYEQRRKKLHSRNLNWALQNHLPSWSLFFFFFFF